MEAPTQCSDSVNSDTNHASQGCSLVSSQPAWPSEVLFLGDPLNARLRQNDLVLQEFSFARLIEETDPLCTELLPSRGLQ
jgi:hypothetical protein